MDILNADVARYLADHAREQHRHPALDRMEERASAHRFPIVGPTVGALLELLARTIGARNVMELGSGFGYSAYWFASGVGPGGRVVCTDGDAANAEAAEDYLTEAGLWDRVNYRVGDALDGLAAETEPFDIVYCDVDKDGYPDCWRAGSERIRVGGLYVADNVLWSGRVTLAPQEHESDKLTEAIVEHNRLIAMDVRFVSAIVPIRDGVMVALRVS